MHPLPHLHTFCRRPQSAGRQSCLHRLRSQRASPWTDVGPKATWLSKEEDDQQPARSKSAPSPQQHSYLGCKFGARGTCLCR